MNEITFNCPTCNQPLEAPPEMAGQLTECPACKATITVSSSHRQNPLPTPYRSVPQRASVPTGFSPRTSSDLNPKGSYPARVIQQKKKGSPNARIAILVLLCLCLFGGGIFYFMTKYGGTTIDGEVFVVTNGGENIKLGLVTVELLDMQKLIPHLEEKYTVLTNELAELEPKLEAAERKYHKNDDYSDKYLDLLRREIELISGSLYFDSMPSSVRTTKTNSDGRFQLKTSGVGKFAILATTSRNIGDKTEEYYWILAINPKLGRKQTILLSNDNLISTRKVYNTLVEPTKK